MKSPAEYADEIWDAGIEYKALVETFARAISDARAQGRREAIEECARVADAWLRPASTPFESGQTSAASRIADRIRALASSPSPDQSAEVNALVDKLGGPGSVEFKERGSGNEGTEE